MVITQAQQGPRPSRAGLWGAGGWHCCGVAGAGTEASGLSWNGVLGRGRVVGSPRGDWTGPVRPAEAWRKIFSVIKVEKHSLELPNYFCFSESRPSGTVLLNWASPTDVCSVVNNSDIHCQMVLLKPTAQPRWKQELVWPFESLTDNIKKVRGKDYCGKRRNPEREKGRERKEGKQEKEKQAQRQCFIDTRIIHALTREDWEQIESALF